MGVLGPGVPSADGHGDHGAGVTARDKNLSRSYAKFVYVMGSQLL